MGIEDWLHHRMFQKGLSEVTSLFWPCTRLDGELLSEMVHLRRSGKKSLMSAEGL